eukprot:2126257-Rhodomonas_salina.2
MCDADVGYAGSRQGYSPLTEDLSRCYKTCIAAIRPASLTCKAKHIAGAKVVLWLRLLRIARSVLEGRKVPETPRPYLPFGLCYAPIQHPELRPCSGRACDPLQVDPTPALRHRALHAHSSTAVTAAMYAGCAAMCAGGAAIFADNAPVVGGVGMRH